MINNFITFAYAGIVLITASISLNRFRKLIPILLVLTLASLPFSGAEIIFASAVTGMVVGYFTKLIGKKTKQAMIPLTLLSLSLLIVLTYRTNSAYLFTLFTGLGASAGVGIAYSTLVLGVGNVPEALKYFTNFRFTVKPKVVANYLTITVISAASTLLANELFGRGYALATGFLIPAGLYAYFRLVKNKYALLTAYFIGAALAWLALTNAGIQSLNSWAKFLNEVIFTWERNAL